MPAATAVRERKTSLVNDVFRQEAEDFPPAAVQWIKSDRIQWEGPADVPVDEIDFSNKTNWRAYGHDKKIGKFARRIQAGDKKAIILTKAPGQSKYKVIDGHHRALAYLKIGRPAKAYIGHVPSITGPWDKMHAMQWQSQPLASKQVNLATPATPAPPARKPKRVASQQQLNQIAQVLMTGGLTGAALTAAVSAIIPGLSLGALAAAVALVEHWPKLPQHGVGPGTDAAVRTNEYRQAAFLIAAYRRLQKAARAEASHPGAVTEELADEMRYLSQHFQASQQRNEAGAKIDSAAATYGPLLGWYASPGDHVTPECEAADGKNFYAAKAPLIGYPGFVHANCKCAPGKPHDGGPILLTNGIPWRELNLAGQPGVPFNPAQHPHGFHGHWGTTGGTTGNMMENEGQAAWEAAGLKNLQTWAQDKVADGYPTATAGVHVITTPRGTEFHKIKLADGTYKWLGKAANGDILKTDTRKQLHAAAHQHELAHHAPNTGLGEQKHNIPYMVKPIPKAKIPTPGTPTSQVVKPLLNVGDKVIAPNGKHGTVTGINPYATVPGHQVTVTHDDGTKSQGSELAYTKASSAPEVSDDSGYGVFSHPTDTDFQFDYGHNAQHAMQMPLEKFKVSDLIPTQHNDPMTAGGDPNANDAPPFVITKGGKHYLIDGHHRAQVAGKNGTINARHMNLDKQDLQSKIEAGKPKALDSQGQEIKAGDYVKSGVLGGTEGTVTLVTSMGPSQKPYVQWMDKNGQTKGAFAHEVTKKFIPEKTVFNVGDKVRHPSTGISGTVTHVGLLASGNKYIQFKDVNGGMHTELMSQMKKLPLGTPLEKMPGKPGSGATPGSAYQSAIDAGVSETLIQEAAFKAAVNGHDVYIKQRYDGSHFASNVPPTTSKGYEYWIMHPQGFMEHEPGMKKGGTGPFKKGDYVEDSETGVKGTVFATDDKTGDKQYVSYKDAAGHYHSSYAKTLISTVTPGTPMGSTKTDAYWQDLFDKGLITLEEYEQSTGHPMPGHPPVALIHDAAVSAQLSNDDYYIKWKWGPNYDTPQLYVSHSKPMSDGTGKYDSWTVHPDGSFDHNPGTVGTEPPGKGTVKISVKPPMADYWKKYYDLMEQDLVGTYAQDTYLHRWAIVSKMGGNKGKTVAYLSQTKKDGLFNLTGDYKGMVYGSGLPTEDHALNRLFKAYRPAMWKKIHGSKTPDEASGSSAAKAFESPAAVTKETPKAAAAAKAAAVKSNTEAVQEVVKTKTWQDFLTVVKASGLHNEVWIARAPDGSWHTVLENPKFTANSPWQGKENFWVNENGTVMHWAPGLQYAEKSPELSQAVLTANKPHLDAIAFKKQQDALLADKKVKDAIGKIPAQVATDYTGTKADYAAKAVPQLTSAEINSIHNYQGSGYGTINAALRKQYELGDQFDPAKLPASTRQHVKNIDSAMAKWAVPHDITISRKIGNAAWLPKDSIVGQAVTEHGYSSTSFSPGVWSGTVVMWIRVPKGMHAIHMNGIPGSVHSGEKELLLPRGTRYVIIEDVVINGTRTIIMEALNPEGVVELARKAGWDPERLLRYMWDARTWRLRDATPQELETATRRLRSVR